MDRGALLRLEEYNPWLADPVAWPAAAERFLPDRPIARHSGLELELDRIELVIGPRQAGKSTLLWLAASELKSPPLVVNLDDALLRSLCQSGAGFLAEVRSLGFSPSAFILEEVQQLEEAGLFLKSLADLRPGVPILVTGSSSFHLRSRTRESLAGRARRTTLLPFSLSEVSAAARVECPPHRRGLVPAECLQRMLRFGGYPRVWLASDEREASRTLLDLVESLIIRDASDLYRIRRPDAFRLMLQLAAGQVGNLVNRAEYASLCGVNATTVAEYMEILEETHVIRLVRPFLGGRRAELTSTPKLFFVDNGLRNHLQGGFAQFQSRGDRGALLENFVFSELAKHLEPLDDLRYWRTRNGAEVDFVLRRGERIVAIEVKAAEMRRPTISRSSRSFIEAYRPAALLVVNPGREAEGEIGGTRVVHCLPERMVGSALPALVD